MKYIILFIFITQLIPVLGQSNFPDSEIFYNKVLNEKIRTVELYKEGWNLSYPIIKLNSTEKLNLHFDLLDNQAETFYYTFIHCDKDWRKSDIFPNDYMGGYNDSPIEDYETSFNTTVDYYHYKLSFPNDRVNLSLSGNYVLIVYSQDDPGKPAIIQRFIISDEAVNINVTAHRPQMTKDNNTHQQVDFIISYSGLSINDTYRNTYAFILQNGRWGNAKQNLRPDFYGNNELKYNSLSDKNIFQGGNEFRYFDIKSIRYQTEYVKKIDYFMSNYNVYLFPSENREFKPYFYWKDLNGKYIIAIQEGQKPEIDADYVNVYFTLPSREEIPGGKIYVSGAFNYWNYDYKNLMTYNPESAQYECTILLKQGWYNYEYVFVKDGSSDLGESIFEGNHYETENDYTIIIYYRNPRERYDRVLGTITANTLNRIAN